ncbi:hypothetical protein GJ496_006672 [Pomphorhynchus laevis]|nr:hypothetical protein GJ496_006672 [Pomphorhynchus laevis]
MEYLLRTRNFNADLLTPLQDHILYSLHFRVYLKMDNENTQEATWTITIKSLSKRKEVSVPAGCTVEKLREEASKLFEIETAQTNLIFGGKILKDNENLKDHGIGSNSTVHLVIRHKKVDDSKPPTTQVSQQPNIDQHTEGAATLPGLPPAPFSSLPFGNANFNEIQQNLFRTLQTDPNAIQNLLSNPMVQGLMSNPELLRSIMLNNPQMQRVIEQNPEVSQFFNNPDFMRQTMEMIRNPTTLQEIMRNHDRALINLESLPGGYNALQRIYRDFQEPMLNATQEQFGYNPLNTNSSSSTTANTSQVGTENTDPLPNPWASQNTVFQNNRSASGLNQLPFNLVDSSRSNVSNTNPLDLPLQSTSSENTARILLNLLRTYGFVQDERQREQVHRVVHEFISQWSIPEIRTHPHKYIQG